MLETCRVGRVTCDRNVNIFFPHDSYTFANVVSAVAVNFCTRTFRVCFTEYFFQFSCIVIIFCFNKCKSVDTSDDLSSIFSKTVQDNTQRFLTYFVCFLSDTNSTFSCCERLMTCQECETFCIFFQKHLTQVTMSQTYFTLICYRSWNTESLQTFADSCCCFRSFCTAFFDCDCCTCDVCPASVLKTDWLDAFDLIVYVQTSIFCDFLCFFQRSDSIAVQDSIDFINSSFI